MQVFSLYHFPSIIFRFIVCDSFAGGLYNVTQTAKINTEKQIIVVDKSDIKNTEFTISGMTCASCEEHVNHAVNKLNGIVNSKASYENGNAIVEFDKTKTNETAMAAR